MALRSMFVAGAKVRGRGSPNIKKRLIRYVAVGLMGAMVVAGCQGEDPEAIEVEGGDPDIGADLIVDYGCSECHYVPGIEEADGGDAPGLQLWPNRAQVAGIPNTPENVIRFIEDPQAVRPGTPMPDLGVSEQDARHITAYLFTLN